MNETQHDLNGRADYAKAQMQNSLREYNAATRQFNAASLKLQEAVDRDQASWCGTPDVSHTPCAQCGNDHVHYRAIPGCKHCEYSCRGGRHRA